MAIVDDIKRDRRTKNVLAQTNTKTVSAPSAATGLVGDQAPAEIFTVSDFDLVKNQVHLEEENFQLMEAINTMGQITNMQSQSGPIPNTQFVSETNSITNSHITVYAPNIGEVWQLVAASIITLDGAASMILNLTDSTTDTRVQIDTFNATSNPLELNEPIFVSNTATLTVRTSDASSGNARLAVSLIRVR